MKSIMSPFIFNTPPKIFLSQFLSKFGSWHLLCVKKPKIWLQSQFSGSYSQKTYGVPLKGISGPKLKVAKIVAFSQQKVLKFGTHGQTDVILQKMSIFRIKGVRYPDFETVCVIHRSFVLTMLHDVSVKISYQALLDNVKSTYSSNLVTQLFI